MLANIALALAFHFDAHAAQQTVTPQGVYAEIDVKRLNETRRALEQGNPGERSAAIEAVKSAPQSFAPPALYSLSKALFDQGAKEDAAFWFYAGQLRARFDANRCAEMDSRQAVAALNDQYGPAINRYAFHDISLLEKLIPRVVEWDRSTAHEYDQRWINLHGMGAMLSGLIGAGGSPAGKAPALSLPESQWGEIAEKTRKEYLDGFQQALKSLKARAASQ